MRTAKYNTSQYTNHHTDYPLSTEVCSECICEWCHEASGGTGPGRARGARAGGGGEGPSRPGLTGPARVTALMRR